MRVTGGQLHQDLTEAAAAAGVPLHRLFDEPNSKLEQLRIAKRPTQSTIDRVRALIAGKPVPPPARAGNYIRDPRCEKDRIEDLRTLTGLAHVQRRPGQTIADCVREMRVAVHS